MPGVDQTYESSRFSRVRERTIFLQLGTNRASFRVSEESGLEQEQDTLRQEGKNYEAC